MPKGRAFNYQLHREDGSTPKVSDKVRIVELERKLAALSRRNKELEKELENSRRWSRAWKRAAKSELDVVSMIRNLRRRRLAVGLDGYAPISRKQYEILVEKLEAAYQQIDFLERELRRWRENAEFFKENNQKLRLRLADREYSSAYESGIDNNSND